MVPATLATSTAVPKLDLGITPEIFPVLHRPRGPIIRSLLDLDWYKFNMGYFVWKYYSDVTVTFSLINRSGWAELGRVINIRELRRELDHVRSLRFHEHELRFIQAQGQFPDKFIDYLRQLRLRGYDLKVTEHGQIDLSFTGPWPMVTYWETLALSILNELYYRAITRNCSELQRYELFAQGIFNLQRNIETIAAYPDIRFSDFGTRRRFSALWQELVVRTLAQELPRQFRGTSNVYLAEQLNLEPTGTMAHELFMVAAALGETPYAIRTSHNNILRQWQELFGDRNSIALTDTFGTKFFFEDFTPAQAQAWKGLRQDSGDPFDFGETAISFYKANGINPKDKVTVFSDGLTAHLIVQLYEHFASQIQTSFGWGTHLTNNLGLDPLSLVIKAARVNGRGTVKLSDNLKKAMGDPRDVERYKQIFGYTATYDVAPVV